MSRTPRSFSPLLLLVFLAACGGKVTVTVTPGHAEVETGESLRFKATVDGTGDERVRWSVLQPGGGTITDDGVYIAPSSPGRFTVVAQSVAKEGVLGSAQVTVVQGAVRVEITPVAPEVEVGRRQQFMVNVGEVHNAVVNWSVAEGEGGGSITPTGLYTAPDTPGTYHVVATSPSNPAITGQMAVRVVPAKVTIFLDPRELTLVAGSSFQFDGVAVGAKDPAVRWSVEPAGAGSITQLGHYTAPAEAGTYRVRVTSEEAPDRSATAEVTVLPRTRQLSGRVEYTGTRRGRVYVVVQGTNTTGTSISSPGPFTVRGIVGEGTVQVVAYIDLLGTGTWNRNLSPLGTAQVALVGDAIEDVVIPLTDPANAVPPAIGAPGVIAGDGAALITVSPALNASGHELATHYTVYWSQTANPGPLNALGSITVRAGTKALVRGLDPAGSYYFSTRAVSLGVEGPLSPPVGPVLAGGGAAGDRAVSGQLTWSEPAPSGEVYVVAWKNFREGRLVRVDTQQAPASWTVGGLSPGDYQVAAFLDRTEEGELGPLDPQSFDRVLMVGLENGDESGVMLDFPAGSVRTRIANSRWIWSEGDIAYIEPQLASNTRLVVRSSLSGPGLASPVDLAQNLIAPGHLSTFVNLGALRPKAGDVWTLSATYVTGETQVIELPLSAVFEEVPRPLSPGPTSDANPVFLWELPTQGPPVAWVELYVADMEGRGVWSQRVPSDTTQLEYGGPALAPGTSLHWYVRAFDAAGNYGTSMQRLTIE